MYQTKRTLRRWIKCSLRSGERGNLIQVTIALHYFWVVISWFLGDSAYVSVILDVLGIVKLVERPLQHLNTFLNTVFTIFSWLTRSSAQTYTSKSKMYSLWERLSIHSANERKHIILGKEKQRWTVGNHKWNAEIRFSLILPLHCGNMLEKWVNHEIFQRYSYDNNSMHCFENQDWKFNPDFLFIMNLLLRLRTFRHRFFARYIGKNFNSEILNEVRFSQENFPFPRLTSLSVNTSYTAVTTSSWSYAKDG